MSKHTKLKTKMNILFNLFKLSDVRIGGQACGGLLPLIGGGPLISVVAKEGDYKDYREMTMEDNSSDEENKEINDDEEGKPRCGDGIWKMAKEVMRMRITRRSREGRRGDDDNDDDDDDDVDEILDEDREDGGGQ